jgi:hypothetical protein
MGIEGAGLAADATESPYDFSRKKRTFYYLGGREGKSRNASGRLDSRNTIAAQVIAIDGRVLSRRSELWEAAEPRHQVSPVDIAGRLGLVD